MHNKTSLFKSELKINTRLLFSLTVLLCSMPAFSAYANSWSVVMWNKWLLLVFGNLIIGVIEGSIVATVFRATWWKTVLLLIIANYLSMWAGAFLFGIGEAPSPIADNIFDIPLYRTGLLMAICFGIAFAISVLLEWPFCWLAMDKSEFRFKKSIHAVLVAQLVSYSTCLGAHYFLGGERTIGSIVSVDKSASFLNSELGAWVYFIDRYDGSVARIRLDGTRREKLLEADQSQPKNALYFYREPDNDNSQWKLFADTRNDNQQVDIRDLPKVLNGRAEAFRDSETKFATIATSAFFLRSSGVADFRNKSDRLWQIKPRGNEGLIISNPTAPSYKISFDTAFQSWQGSSVTILPGDIAVFEFGKQICLLDIKYRLISFLTMGKGPVVVLDEPVTSSIAD